MNTKAYIDKIEFFVPAYKLSNKALKEQNPSWDIDKIFSKTGIQNRNIVERPVKPKHPEPASAQQSESFHCLPKDGEYAASSTSVNKLGVRHQAETFAETATLK